jgi:hypothetical protein
VDITIKGHGFTPTQERILNLLVDGRKHASAELKLAIDPTGQADDQNLSWHLSKIREKLRKRGQTISPMGYSEDGLFYQWMRNIAPASSADQ